MIEDLAHNLTSVANSPSTPIQATKDWASRNLTLATGLGGINLALAEFGRSQGGVELDISATEVWGGQFQWNPLTNTLKVHPTEDQSKKDYLGDIFEGQCGLFWSSLILKTKFEEVTAEPKFGAVSRPGIAHGNLIRDLYLWHQSVQYSTAPLFYSAEPIPNQPGWCNGVSGEIAAKVVANSIQKNGDVLQNLSNYEVPTMLQLVSQSTLAAESGLCHGILGALVVAAGAARIAGDFDTLVSVQEMASGLFDNDLLLRYPDDLLVDYSWLTGSAGVLWAILAIHRRPLLNPLLPFDSELWQ